MNNVARAGIESFGFATHLHRKEQTVPIDVRRDMVEVTSLQPGKRDGVRELQRCSILSFGGDPEQKQKRQSDSSRWLHGSCSFCISKKTGLADERNPSPCRCRSVNLLQSRARTIELNRN